MSVKNKKEENETLKSLKRRIKKADKAKIARQCIPYVLFGYFGDKLGYAWRITEEPDFFDRLLGCLMNLVKAFHSLLPSLYPKDLLFGLAVGIGMRLIVYFRAKNAKKYRHGVEYGSARWGTQKDIEPLMDLDDPDNNIILTKTEGIRLNGRPKDPKLERNRNVVVIGGSGSGKTRFFVKPNIMQLHGSYVITDPKGYFWIGQ